MNHDSYTSDYLRDILSETRTIAVVGASPKPERPSYGVIQFLIACGYEVIPVNPGFAGKTILGQTVHASLADVPAVDMVDVFRNSDAVGGVVDEVLAMPELPKLIWMQIGVRNDEAAARAEAEGIKVGMNRCPKIDYPRVMKR
ncbi:hypothetical protein SAMN05216548_102296 [Faunimonas pinastri]|uniref:CoA-binding domain-containing protein n=1 Tax=Faunimonas pinastri TaxID=1855383 RepID=A0A1H9CZ42_9HYPH|nr:CoA-binding protein [Faunimonas pinastri]SEQ06409.1 hypothetical protein SAMN05216548_102296 [Faunimonas pinastri]